MVLGLGRAGTALLREFVEARVPVAGAWNRSPRPLSSLPPGVRFFSGPMPPPELFTDCELALLTVRDDAIREVAAGFDAGSAALLHCSGSAGVELLADARAASRGSWHPLQAFGTGRSPDAEPFPVALEGEPAAIELGERLAQATGHPTVRLRPGSKPAYHAAAVLASNALVALEAVAMRSLLSAGVSEAEAWPLLRPLVRGTLDNLDRGRPGEVVTGPIARGDAETVARNLRALPDEASRTVYRVLGAEGLALVEARLAPEDVRALRRLLREPGLG